MEGLPMKRWRRLDSSVVRVSVLALALVALGACKKGDKGEDDGEGGATSASSSSSSTVTGTGTGGGVGEGGSGPGGGSEGGSGPGGGQGGNGEGGDGSSTSSTGGGGSAPEGWEIFTHTCSGASRTDALLVEDDGTMWVGCGTNQVGYGLHVSFDGGVSWAEVESEELEQFRVSAVQRGDDGLLYFAGFDANDSDMVFSLDTTTEPWSLGEVLVGGNQVGTRFHVGSMAVLSEGRIFVESLTGYGALWRPDADVGTSGLTWDDAYYWANDGSPPGYQMMDLFAHGDDLYGSGATIAEPPYVFLPPRSSSADPYQLEVVELPNTGWTGEMWGVAADDDRVVVVGVDQDGDIGKIYVSGADRYEASDYTEIDLPDIVGDSNLGTWARGVCLRGDRVVVVGERQPLSAGTGLVLLSDDGGATFTNITPEDDVTESVSKCHVNEAGEVIVAGAGGLIGIYR
jgi:hypothetical protein